MTLMKQYDILYNKLTGEIKIVFSGDEVPADFQLIDSLEHDPAKTYQALRNRAITAVAKLYPSHDIGIHSKVSFRVEGLDKTKEHDYRKNEVNEVGDDISVIKRDAITDDSEDQNDPEVVKVTSLSVETPETNLKVGQTFNIETKMEPEGSASKADLVYESSDASVAKVSRWGKVTAEGVGEATVRVALKANLETFTDTTVKVEAAE